MRVADGIWEAGNIETGGPCGRFAESHVFEDMVLKGVSNEPRRVRTIEKTYTALFVRSSCLIRSPGQLDFGLAVYLGRQEQYCESGEEHGEVRRNKRWVSEADIAPLGWLLALSTKSCGLVLVVWLSFFRLVLVFLQDGAERERPHKPNDNASR